MRKITENVILLGNGHSNFFLIGQEEAALVECGTGAGAAILARQWSRLDRKPEIRYIVALHSHFDHICGVPILKRLFPRARLAASAGGQKLLSRDKIVAGLFKNDRLVSEYYYRNGIIKEIPDYPPPSTIPVDMVVGEGDVLTLGDNLRLKIIDAPGHSICSIAAYVENDGCMLVSDATGYPFSDGTIAPVFYHSYGEYMTSIRNFMTYSCQALCPAHGDICRGEQVGPYLRKALESGQEAFDYIGEQLRQGTGEKVLADRLDQRYTREGLCCYPDDLMKECMFLLIKRVKTEMGT